MHKHTKSNPQSVTRAIPHTPPWIRLVGTLLLALVIGAIHQPALALETPSSVEFGLTTSIKPQEICVSDIDTIRVFLQARAQYKSGQVVTNLLGFPINATVDNPGVLGLVQAQQRTGWDLETPISVGFDIRGLQEGTARLTFSVDPISAYGRLYNVKPTTSTVKVVNCRYQVDLLSRWYLPLAPGNTIELEAIVSRGVLTRKEDGTYSGTGTVVWLYNIVTPCEHQDTIPDTKVTLNGILDDDGQLQVKVKYSAATVSETAVCRTPKTSVSTSSQNQATPGDLDVLFPTSKGGVQRQSQYLINPVGRTSGFSTIAVAPAP